MRAKASAWWGFCDCRGVGPIVALAFMAAIDDINRFPSDAQRRISISPDFRARNSEQMVSEFVARHVSPV